MRIITFHSCLKESGNALLIVIGLKSFCRFCVIFANRHPSCGTVGVVVVSPLKRFKTALEQCHSQTTNFHQEAMEKSELFFNMIENRTNVMEMSN